MKSSTLTFIPKSSLQILMEALGEVFLLFLLFKHSTLSFIPVSLLQILTEVAGETLASLPSAAQVRASIPADEHASRAVPKSVLLGAAVGCAGRQPGANCCQVERSGRQECP